MTQGQVGRADLLRAYQAEDLAFQEQVATHLGFEFEDIQARKAAALPKPEHTQNYRTDSDSVQTDQYSNDDNVVRTASQEFRPEPVSFWQPFSYVAVQEVCIHQPESEPEPHPRVTVRSTAPVPLEPLAPVPFVLSSLRRLAEMHEPSRRPDLVRLVREISKGRSLERIPQKRRRSWAPRISIIADHNLHLLPYRTDTKLLRQGLTRNLSRSTLTIAELPAGLTEPLIRSPGTRHGFRFVAEPDSVVVAITDLGCLANDADWLRDAWLHLGQEYQDQNVACIAVFPGRPESVSPELNELWEVVPWERGVRAVGRVGPEASEAALQRLLSFLALASRVEPPLLRAVRRLIAESRFDAGLEARVWHHPDVISGHPLAATINPEKVSDLVSGLKDEDGELIEAVLDLIYRAHRCQFEGIWHTEVANLPEAMRRHVPLADLKRMEGWFNDRKATFDNSPGTLETEIGHEFLRVADQYYQPGARRRLPVLDEIWTCLFRDDSQATPPETMHPSQLSDRSDDRCRIQIEQHRSGWEFITGPRDGSGTLSCSQLATVDTQVQKIRVDYLLASSASGTRQSFGDLRAFNLDEDFWSDEPPAWASGWGIDEVGPWCEFEVSSSQQKDLDAGESAAGAGTKVVPNGERIAQLRDQNNWFHEELAARCGLSESTIQRMEKGKEVGRETLAKVAEALYVKPESLMADSGAESSSQDTSVTQRMRWVAAGTFLMGSPKGEPGRYGDEGPQHEVRISRGFWMFDTPCTQALWEAVMGENPSQFQTPDRPVENVSWEDCQKFFERLKERVPGLDIDLPTEAEWEFGCRAAADAAPYDGAFEILGTNNAPALDPFAWYGGNSGVNFELADGVDLSSRSDKQYEFDKAGTHPVAKKEPNRLGLFDMLGNVDEWCRDSQRSYEDTPAEDPIGTERASAYRVFRGGSWNDYARSVRAAYRSSLPPGRRNYCIGFRCRVLSSGPSQAAAEQAGQGGSPQRAVSRRSPKAEPGGDSEQASEVRPTGRVSNESATQHSDQNAAAATPAAASRHSTTQDEQADSPRDQRFLDILASIRLEELPKPEWAAEWGRDEFGLWAELSVFRPMEIADATMEIAEATMSRDEAGNRVAQRLRLIPPGTFLMGSPDTEDGRADDEGPQHEVKISQAFWMFDSPCTQALWEAVTGHTPSHFKGGDRPVENISWEDCQKFNEQFSAKFASTEISLPTEAEWEYACRAGTTEARYGEINQVAWYWENSSQETHSVHGKLPNRWGLYDTLGNVREWCRDGQRSYEDALAEDPIGAEDASASRVIRGGSWGLSARDVRAAFRDSLPPGARNDYIGFRCRVRELRIQQVVEQAAAGGLPASSEGRASVELRRRKAEPGGDSETTSVARAAWINLLNSDSDQTPIPQSPAVRIVTDVEELTLRKIPKPSWASAIGRDRFGLWCEFEIASDVWKEFEVAKLDDEDQPRDPIDESEQTVSFSPRSQVGVVTQRFRWIPPGQFMFGSPKGEPVRLDEYEFDPTQQIVDSGFWMFDTPCTQSLWSAVMGRNPAHFQSPTRPVENVSWNDCRQFLHRLGEQCREKGFELELPGELEWEYACRAGTTEATYAGPMEILGERNAPILDPIAWYGGNCGVDFDSPDGFATSDWREKQYEFETGGTRRVATRQANAWGLYDTLGNVWEWCDDVWRLPDDEASESKDDASAFRVIRGGSWGYNARAVRAAYRVATPPDSRSYDIGFRCRVRELKPGGSGRGAAPHTDEPSKGLLDGIVDRFRGKKSDD